MKQTVNSWLFMALLASSALAQAQLYKSVGPDGKVTYSDAPPPASAAKVETKSFATSSDVSTAGLPYELAQAVKNNPVILYSGSQCAPCDNARTFLKTRGIPFSEKTVTTNADVEKLKKISGQEQLPLLLVGRSKQKGFEQSAWGTALTAAGYPESSKLPPGYRPPPPEAAAPEAKPAVQQARHGSDRPADELPQREPATGNAPPGFRF